MKSKYLIFATAFTIVLVGAGCSVASGEKANEIGANATSTDLDDLAVDFQVSPGVEIVSTDSGMTATSSKDYVAALRVYGKNGMRFQFSNCSGNPGSLIVKKGAKFMIDNRDNETHQIGIGPKSYQLNAFEFAIVSVQKASTINITCDGGGSARVIVQN